MIAADGYIYARPMSEENWKRMNEMVDPQFVGALFTTFALISTSLNPFPYLKLATMGPMGDDRFSRWEDKGRPYKESGVLWITREHCFPPLTVAGEAERFIDEIRKGGADALKICDLLSDGWVCQVTGEWEGHEELLAPECIRATQGVIDACRFAADQGAEEVTVCIPE